MRKTNLLFCIFIFIFSLLGICVAGAQDLIVLRDGNIIKAKVIEISPTEIRYRRYNHLTEFFFKPDVGVGYSFKPAKRSSERTPRESRHPRSAWQPNAEDYYDRRK